MKLNLLFLDSFETEFKGKNYKVFRFLDKQSLIILSGTDLIGEFTQFKPYECTIEWKNNKLKVVAAQ